MLSLTKKNQFHWLKTKVFKLDSTINPAQGSGHGFCSGRRVLIGSPGPIPIFFINQNDVVLVKNNSQWVATRFFTWSCQVTQAFDFPYFFLNPARCQFWAGLNFKTMLKTIKALEAKFENKTNVQPHFLQD